MQPSSGFDSARACVEPLERRRLLSAAVPNFDHIVVVIEENKGYSEIIGSPEAPYINSLAASGALFTNSTAVTHPSQPNYLALFSGSTQGITSNTLPSAPLTAANLGAELLAANDTFVGYSESLPSVGFLGASATTVPGQNQYWRKHNPWSDFQSDTPSGNLLPATVNQPFSAFPSDFTTLPTVSFVVPNEQNDMHDGTIAMGDAWLQSNMQAYADWAAEHKSLLIVQWDENDGPTPNQIATIFFGAGVKSGNYAEPINHYNVLRTIEDSRNLAHAGASATAVPITDCWSTTPTTTSVAGSISSPVYGQAVTFTATVTPQGVGSPTGTVQFKIDGSNAGAAVALTGNVASFSTSKLTAGVHSISATYSGDFNFIGSSGATAPTVARRVLTGSVTAKSKTYDGTTAAAIASRLLSGVVVGDSVSLSGGIAKFSDNNVGNNKTVTATGLTLTGAAAWNYALRNPTEITAANITVRSLAVTANNFTRVYGQPNPLLSANISGLIAADGITVGETTAATQYSRAGTYAIVPTVKDPNHRLFNYAVKIVNGVLTVRRANTTTTTSNITAVHGTTITLTAHITANSPSRAIVATGHVTFYIENLKGVHLKTVSSAAPVNGLATARISLSGLAIGSYTLVASYVADATKADFNGSATVRAGGLRIT